MNLDEQVPSETHPATLTDKWQDQTLTINDIVPKVRDYARSRNVPLTLDEAESIARQIHRAYKKYHDPKEYAGDFIYAFAKDNISLAFSIADNLNARALIVYHYYFYNCVPGDWRQRLR